MKIAVLAGAACAVFVACGGGGGAAGPTGTPPSEGDVSDSVEPDGGSAPADAAAGPDVLPTGDEGGDDPADQLAPDGSEPSDTGPEPDAGPPCDCDDGNPCTKDVCLGDGSCEFFTISSKECGPTLTVDTPERAAWIYGSGAITVAGTVTAPVGLDQLTVAGAPVTPSAVDTYQTKVGPSHGINSLVVRATDKKGVPRKVVQAFVAGDAFYPTTDGDANQASVTNGLVAYLGAEVFDDDDPSDADDLSTIVTLILESIDIAALIESATGEGAGPSALWCQWDVAITSVGYTVTDVDLVPVTGGLALAATIQNVTFAFAVTDPTFACPDAVGNAVIATVQAEATISLWLGADGSMKASVDAFFVELSDPAVDLTGGFASLFDWLVDWFSGPISNLVESAIEGAVLAKVAPALAAALETFASYETTLTVPSIMEVTPPIAVTVAVSPTDLAFTPQGATIGLGVGITVPKGVPSLEAVGSLARDGCFAGSPPSFVAPHDAPIVLAVHDDVINQLLFAAWWGGATHVDIPPSLLGALGTSEGIEKLSLKLAPLLPPVLTGCTPKGFLQLQLGDAGVSIDFELNGAPGGAEIFVSAALTANVVATPGPDGTVNLGIEILSLDVFDFQVMSASGFLVGSEPLIEVLVGTVVVDVIADKIAGGFAQSFPVPKFDLSKVLDTLPAGTSIGFAPKSLGRDGGYTVLSGGVAP